MVTETKPRCPWQKGSPAVYDFEHDEVYEGAMMCKLNDKWCVLESGDTCETYEEYLRDLSLWD